MNYYLLFMVSVYCLMVVPIGGDYFYLPRAVALALLSIVAGFSYFKGTGLISIKRCPSLLIFLLLVFVSSILGMDPVNSWFGYPRCTGLSTYLFCTVLFLVAAESRQQQNSILRYAVFTGMIISALAILQWFDINLVPHEFYRDGMISYSTMANQNFLASYTVFLLPPAMLWWLQQRKIIWLGAAAILFAALLASTTRGAWIAFVFMGLYILLQVFKGKYTWKAFSALLVTLAVVFLLLAPTRGGLIVSRVISIPGEVDAGVKLDGDAGAGRIYIWKESLKLFPQNWAFGIGPENLKYADIEPIKGTYADKAHNIFIEILVTMGIFAFIAFIVFLARVIKIPENDDEEVIFLMITTYLVQGFFNIDVIMVMPLFWIIMGFSFGIKLEKLPREAA
ncbi:MAG: O-antigen ligase family protein [Syntrophomonadaceae bacterium]|nr:O-antigen ligase family protein [Syntrophomonadaceae bacterium]